MKLQNAAILALALLLSACGGGSGSGGGSSTNTATSGTGNSAGPDTQQACTNKFGRTWTEVDAVKKNIPSFDRVIYGNGLFLGTGHKTAVSRDGENWNDVSSSLMPGQYLPIFAAGKFFMVGQAYALTTQTVITQMVIVSSSDGIHWDNTILADSTKPSASTVPIFEPYGFSYGNGRFVAVGSDGKIIWSADGKNWNPAANIADFKVYVFGWSAFVNGKFYASGSTDNTIYVSSDGNNWQMQKIITDADTTRPIGLTGMQYVNGQYIASDSAGSLMYSKDSITWKTILKGRHSDNVNGNAIVTGAGQLMVADIASSFTNDGDYILYSCDGMNWEKTKVPNGTFSYSIAIGDDAAVITTGPKHYFSKY
ncbi:WD40/YVTN/BNR-like repeat-containing protein [Undibacterium sp. JH2W]